MDHCRRLYDIEQWRNENATLLATEQSLPDTVGPARGYCGLCQRETNFEGSPLGDIRERLACGHCGVIARHRAVYMVLQAYCADLASAHVYATEQASGFYRMLRKRVGRLQGGEFGLGVWRSLRVQLWLLKNGISQRLRLRDLTALDFADATFDAVASMDVLEHVPDHQRALHEVVRVLRPGGIFVFTVPFYHDRVDCKRVAWQQPDGTLAFEGAPEYHGDPVSGGVLCFHHFGWDLLAQMRQAGFAEAAALWVQSSDHGLPVGQWVLYGRR